MRTLHPRPAALVTGATRGIGLAIARALGEEGYRVTISDRTAADVVRVVAELLRDGVDAIGVVADVSRREDVERLVSTHREVFDRLDVLVSNAGTCVAGSVETLAVDEFERAL
jgi:NAD(P)-dependent dehydrogenase (short-subunit alcohol dehydrogenase family)